MSNDVADNVSLVLILHNLAEKSSWLREIVIGMSGLEATNKTSDSLSAELSFRERLVLVEGRRLIIGLRSLISIDAHGAISLTIGNTSSVWAVNWDLIVVSSESVTMSVRVREKSTLEHFVHRGFHTRDEVSRGESRLLSVLEVVFWVSVEDQFTNSDKRIVRMRPDLGDIKNVPSVLETIVNWH